MAAHSTLTGADLHEPKGVASATSGTVYSADGAGSGSWVAVTTLFSITGMIADFATPVAPTGWLECDGSAVSRATYSSLFTAQTIQQSGTRTSGSAIITGLSSTTNMKPGYYVSGTGLTANSTIVTVDGATQITISANAGSSGTATVVVSPWQLGDGSTTFNLPNATKRYRRARDHANVIYMGALQDHTVPTHTHSGTTLGGSATSNGAHTHALTGGSAAAGGSHTHTGTTAAGSAHQHEITAYTTHTGGITTGIMADTDVQNSTSINTGLENSHTHTFTTDSGGSHTHTLSGTADSNGDHTHTLSITGSTGTPTDLPSSSTVGSENRPFTMVVMTCVKT